MPALELENLTKTYGTLRALDGVSFTVESGEIFGFVGSNGAGKTTTMRIVLGVLSADGGDVRWGGRPITLDDRRQIGYMPEERGLYPKMRVGDQLEYFARLHGLTPSAARASAHRWAETLGVAQRLGDEVQNLSLGNQQRVQLAAALVHEPEVLVLDEPFSGLDPVAVDVMSGVLRDRAAAGVPVIFSSHQLDLVERLCHRVGIIKTGRMVANGTIGELRTTDRPRWEVVGPTDPRWLATVPGAHVISRSPAGGPAADGAGGTADTWIVEAAGDGQDLLHAAVAAGPVREFSPSRPSLTDLYRHVVSAEEDAR